MGTRVAFDVGFDGEVREELDGQDPGFEGAVLLADEDAVFAGDGEGFEGSVGARRTGPAVSKAMGAMGERVDGGVCAEAAEAAARRKAK